MDMATVFEILMLVIFGCSWPVNISKSLKSRTTLGKSLAYEYLVVLGYLFGLTAKILIYCSTGRLQYSFYFYIIDIVLVVTDIIIYHRNLSIDRQEGRI